MTSFTRSLHAEEIKGYAVSDLDLEVVERKGSGHPDSLIDGASEAVSLALSQYYLDNFGAILHHNVDKGILVGGTSKPKFGGGRMVDPIYLMIAGRATDVVPFMGKREVVPVAEIAQGAIKGFIRNTMRYLDPVKHVKIETKIRQGSSDLISVFLRNKEMPISNDTSVGVGFAPLSPTERMVYDIEQLLNSQKTKKKYPEVGEDVKVMGMRMKKKLNITVAAAMIGKLIPDADHYQSVMEELRGKLADLASTSELDVNIKLNSGDDPRRGSYYLTVTGTSAEQGDDGNTGRGNRVNGLICPMREYSMEATAGKNPVNHTGKLYNAVALLAADRIVKEVKGVREAYVRILSRIGNAIDNPQIASAAVVLERPARISQVRPEIELILNESLTEIRGVTNLILQKRIILF